MTNSENKICQNCKQGFVIEPDDFSFYEKIKVPAPTWCPECRLRRRLVWRNERTLYKHSCNAPGHTESLVSIFSSNKPYIVYDQEFWWSDQWDPMQYGREYDFGKPFFEQFRELMLCIPHSNLLNINMVNSEYCNFNYQAKNCYLCFASDLNEDSAYLYHTAYTKGSFDLLACQRQESCYESIHSEGCYSCSFVYFSEQCLNSAFLYDCRNCQYCFGCINLRNAKYNIFNKAYSKENYEREIEKYRITDYASLAHYREQFDKFCLMFPRRFADVFHSNNVSGDYLRKAKNCHVCFDVDGPAEDSGYIVYGVPGLRDCYDSYGLGAGMENGYELTASGGGASNVAFSVIVHGSHSVSYSYFCRNCSNCFGCVALRDKQYCIFNQQYTKDAYEKLVPKIIQHMNEMPYVDKQGKTYQFGEFFPSELSPFAYQETIAQEYFPMGESQGREERSYKITKHSKDLLGGIQSINESILQEIIGCIHEGKCMEQCTTAFKIIPEELRFYKKMGLPVPDLCPNCRHYARLKKRNPFRLWRRVCGCGGAKSANVAYTNTETHFHGSNPCPNGFETSYAPERPEVVYCEACYQAEII